MIEFAKYLRKGIASTLLLSVVASTALANSGPRIPVLEQRKAILDCRYEMGLRGGANFGAIWPELPPGGHTVTWIVPGSNLSPAQADMINECADERLGRAATPRFATGAQTERKRGYRYCPSHAPVLFGGSAYCIKGN